MQVLGLSKKEQLSIWTDIILLCICKYKLNYYETYRTVKQLWEYSMTRRKKRSYLIFAVDKNVSYVSNDNSNSSRKIYIFFFFEDFALTFK